MKRDDVGYEIKLGDCRESMAALPESSVDAIVTDPPYELGFMGKKWDGTGVAFDVETWKQALRVLKPGGHLLAFSGTRTYHRMVCAIEDAGFEVRDQIGWVYGSGFPKSKNLDGDWRGWGTALKPAWEPIVVARKPLIGTVAANVLAHGTGALNIDGCRVDGAPRTTHAGGNRIGNRDGATSLVLGNEGATYVGASGRWPANIIHDGSDEVLAVFPGDEGRFFYCAKASKRDRGDGNNHPTVKPTDLMRYLVRLVTPPGGLVLDPFMGSGSTGKAAALEGFRFVGCELSEEYIRIAQARISGVNVSPMNAVPDQMTLPID